MARCLQCPCMCTKPQTFTKLLGCGPLTQSTQTAAVRQSITLTFPLPTLLLCKKSSLLMKVLAWPLKGRQPELDGTFQFSLEFALCLVESVPARRWLLEATMAWGLRASPLPSCLVVPRVALHPTTSMWLAKEGSTVSVSIFGALKAFRAGTWTCCSKWPSLLRACTALGCSGLTSMLNLRPSGPAGGWNWCKATLCILLSPLAAASAMIILWSARASSPQWLAAV